MASWSVQLDSPVTNSEWVDQAWGGGGKTSGVGRGLFWHNPFSKQQCSLDALTASTLFLPCPSHLNQASVENDYQDKSRAQWGGGRPRQSPSVLGGEGQSLGTKDIFSWGLVHIRWSHVYINLVTCMKPITNRFETRMLVVAVDIRRTQLLILEILWHTCLSCGTQQWPFQQVFFFVRLHKHFLAPFWITSCICACTYGRNIVGCYMFPPFADPVAWCCMLLGVVV